MKLFLEVFFLFLAFSTCVKVCFSVNPANEPQVAKTITVDYAGGGDFTTVQSAIDSIPPGNDQWIRIHVKAGTYREKVQIQHNQPYIILEGESRSNTKIVWDDYGTSRYSATFTSLANNFAAKWITFENSHTFTNDKDMKPAVAAYIAGDMSSFQECGFIGVQDTLADLYGRHYFISCYIEGSVDFIFGFGQSIYKSCSLHVNRPFGWITAQGRNSSEETNGYVFKYCYISGTGQFYFGRAWGSHSRVIFYKTFVPATVNPLGWDAWTYKGAEGNLSYGESGCWGPGAVISNRVRWEKNLSPSELDGFVRENDFINKDGWIEQQVL